MDAQQSAARIRPPEEGKISASVRRAYIPDTSAASGPEPGTRKDPDPRRRSSRGSGGSEQACLPGNGGYATPAACPVSTTSWRYGLRRTCRLVTGRSHRPRSTSPNQARLALLAVTHRNKRARRRLWLEQFHIADSVRLARVLSMSAAIRRSSDSVVTMQRHGASGYHRRTMVTISLGGCVFLKGMIFRLCHV